MRVRFACSTAVAAALIAAAPAAATTAEQAVQFLNQQRAANQIPANVQLDSYRTTGCHNHVRYMEQNGLKHGEQPGEPGYTPEGADYSNSGEVLAEGGQGFSETTNPWDAAPLHQGLLFDPSVNQAGYDDDGVFFCMRFGFDFTAPSSPTFYAFTSNTGREGVPTSETVNGEGPYAPQEAVGIPQGTPTGPQILFFVDGFGSKNHATAFSLKGPGGGEVEAKMVDSTTPPPNNPDAQSYGPAFHTGGDLIPVHQLDPFTDYQVSVTWHNDDNGQEMAQTLSFKTAGFQRGLALKLASKLSRGRRAKLTAPAEAVGQKASVKISIQRKGHRAKRVSSRTITLKTSQKIKLPKKPGPGGAVILRVSVKPFTLGDTRFTVVPAQKKYRR
jgi:hypothetical protein